MLRFIDYKKYPFLADVNDIVGERWTGLTILDLIKLNSVVRERCLEILRDVIERGEVRRRPSPTTEEEVLSFYAVIIIASVINNKWLRDRIAIAYSKYAQSSLKNEDDYVVEAIAKKLGIDLIYDPDNCPKIPLIKRGTIVYRFMPYSMSLKDYLRYTKRLINEPKYALINQIVDGGRVYTDKDIVIRIISEAITEYIKGLVKPIEKAPKEIEDLVDEALKLLKDKLPARAHSAAEAGEAVWRGIIGEGAIIDFGCFPPCMAKLVEDLKRGENLSHHARFAIAAFLSRIGMDVDSILELFKNVPDFNEKIARYQIEHIAGLRGSRKQYMPYSCGSMKSLGLCPLVDGDCGVKNPLVAYRRNLVRRLKRRSKPGKGGGRSQ